MKPTSLKAKTMLRLSTLALALLCCAASFGQAAKPGRLDVKFATPSLDSLVTSCAKSDKNMATLDGFRIQIYSGSTAMAKEEAMKAQAKFQNINSKDKAYVIYTAPFWRVRVGDYRFRTEALEMLEKIKGAFPGCYIVKDNTVRKAAFKN